MFAFSEEKKKRQPNKEVTWYANGVRTIGSYLTQTSKFIIY